MLSHLRIRLDLVGISTSRVLRAMAQKEKDFELFAFESIGSQGTAEQVLLADSALHEASGSLFTASLLGSGAIVLRQTPAGQHGPASTQVGTEESTTYRLTWFTQRGAAVTAMSFSDSGAVLAVTTRDGALLLFLLQTF